MIQVKDLRLGNYIIWNPKLSNPHITLLPMMVEVVSVAGDKIGYTPYKLEQRVEPFEDDRMIEMETTFKSVHEFELVNLDLQHLEKIGFTNKNGAYQLKGFYPQLFLKNNLWIVDLVPGSCKMEIRYLHQLQNLYYMLTNEDLEIIL